MLTSFVRGLAGVILIAAVAACGGGGGGSGGGGGGGSGGGGGGSGLTWTQGVFQPASTFINRCAVVRTGNDSQGRPFPDMAGTLQHELFWLRSWTNQTYLWNTEVTDQNPAGFSDRVAYFNVLKTNQAAASGKPKDNFHFTMLTADYLAQQTSAPTAGYGAEILVFTGTPPRDVRVLYTQTGTPAAALLGGTPKLARGTRILSVDGVDLVNGGTSQAQIDTLNNGLFPRTAGENHTFTVRYPDNSERSITLTSASIVETPVNRQTVLTTASGKVGYVLFNTFSPFSSEKALYDTMNAFSAQGVSDVVLDLRYNGGGLLAVASQLSYMVAGNARTAGHNFERLQFNAAAGNTNPVTGGANAPTPFYSTGLGFTVADGTPLPALNLSRVYILSTSGTCSASESVINGLRGIDVDVVLIGATTCGKPYGFYPADNCGQTYFSIQFRGINDKSFGDYPDGFAAQNTLSSPFAVKISGCAVADDFTRELGDPAEAMLAAALNHRAGGACPTPPSSVGVASVPTAGLSIESTGRSDVAQVLRNNRDMRMPN
ncbi:MAG TPA: S41 family peptidase [Hyphomonadaceae bacterium]|nr:S41 family peptidase [Hyphomonadaceae bacterium]